MRSSWVLRRRNTTNRSIRANRDGLLLVSRYRTSWSRPSMIVWTVLGKGWGYLEMKCQSMNYMQECRFVFSWSRPFLLATYNCILCQWKSPRRIRSKRSKIPSDLKEESTSEAYYPPSCIFPDQWPSLPVPLYMWRLIRIRTRKYESGGVGVDVEVKWCVHNSPDSLVHYHITCRCGYGTYIRREMKHQFLINSVCLCLAQLPPFPPLLLGQNRCQI